MLDLCNGVFADNAGLWGREMNDKLIKYIIDIVWEATDGGCKLTVNDFSHFSEPINSLLELEKYINEKSITGDNKK